MGIFEDTFQKILTESLTEEKVLASIVKNRLSEMGIDVTSEQLAKIEARFAESELHESNELIDFSDLVPESIGDEHVIIGDADFDEYLENATQKIDVIIPNLIEDTALRMKNTLVETSSSMLVERRGITAKFEERLFEKWGEALDILEVVIVSCNESGDSFNSEYRPQAAQENNLVFEALTRLHARSCQVAQEVATLLRSGFADGAHARWRTLHEINIVSTFIAEKGNDAANRYLLHQHVESYKAACQIREHHARLGMDDIPDEELSNLRHTRDGLIAQFGSEYRHDYGWASSSLGNPRPNFSDIEQSVSFDHMRPYYKLASHNVHANPKGVYFKLGLLNSHIPLMLAGASDEGLADPGSATAISLAQNTIGLLTLVPNMDRTIYAKIIWWFAEECSDAFMEIHHNFNRNQP